MDLKGQWCDTFKHADCVWPITGLPVLRHFRHRASTCFYFSYYEVLGFLWRSAFSWFSRNQCPATSTDVIGQEGQKSLIGFVLFSNLRGSVSASSDRKPDYLDKSFCHFLLFWMFYKLQPGVDTQREAVAPVTYLSTPPTHISSNPTCSCVI